MTRATPEWIGKTDDAAIPPRVRLRVFEAHGGICAISGRKIMPGDRWQVDHAIALVNGGQHRESNFQPVLDAAHKTKTRADVATKAKIASVRKKHLGIDRKRATLPGSKSSRWKRRIDGTVVPRS